MLSDMIFCFLLELNLVPVKVERHHGVDGVTELRSQQQRVDSIYDVAVRSIDCPVTV